MRTVSVWRNPVWDLFETFEPSRVAHDVEEKDDHFLLSFDVPGFAKGDVNIEVSGDDLIVEAKNRERGVFRRVITLPNTIDAAKIEAHQENGVLRIALPKAQSAIPRKIPIAIGGDAMPGSGGFFSRLLGKSEASPA